MPYFCYVHNGLYVKGDVDGCHEPSCLAFKEVEVPPVGPFFGDVPGAYNESQRTDKFHRNFDSDMDAYYKARKEGLKPKATNKAAVVEAQETVRSQKRALKKLKRAGGEAAKELLTAPGVE